MDALATLAGNEAMTVELDFVEPTGPDGGL
jgi:hypothetical protein